MTALVASLLLPVVVATVMNFALAQSALLGISILLWLWAKHCQTPERKQRG
jgi:hypothetical protein